MTSDSNDTDQEKGLLGWAVPILIISSIVLLIVVYSQNTKTSRFEKKYKSYIDKVMINNQNLSKFEIIDMAANQRIGELASGEFFDYENYRKFIKQIPSNIKQKGDTGERINAFSRAINDRILKDMNQYLNKTNNPTLEGAIAFIEKDSLQNLIRSHTGRTRDGYTQLYRPFYNQALKLKK